MRDVQTGDLILHLVSDAIIGTSVASSRSQEIDQFGRPYYIIRLADYVAFEVPLGLQAVFSRHAAEYSDMAAQPGAHVFFKRDLKLRQGAYITPAPALFLADVASYRSDFDARARDEEVHGRR